MKEVYPYDIVKPLIVKLTKLGEKTINYNSFAKRLLKCKEEFPQVFKNFILPDVGKQIDVMSYLGLIEYPDAKKLNFRLAYEVKPGPDCNDVELDKVLNKIAGNMHSSLEEQQTI